MKFSPFNFHKKNRQAAAQAGGRAAGHRGFTLPEAIVYIVLAVILLVAIITMFVDMGRSWSSIRADKGMAYSSATALERMSREIRDADSVNTASSTFNTSPGKLVLNVYTSGGATTTMAFYVNTGGILEIEEASGTSPLILSDTSVTSLTFRHITTSQSEAVRIEMTLKSTYSGITKSDNFYDTDVVRGSYQN